MKTTKFKAAASIILLSATLGFVSCDNDKHDHTADEQHHAESKTEEVAKDQNDAKFNDNDDEKNAKFLVKASEINLEEIALGKLAIEKSKNADVKALGTKMVAAHTKANEELKGLAAKKNISIPTENTQDVNDTYRKFTDKTDLKEFNQDYADKMVSGHKDAIDLFEKQSTESSDADIRAWATSMLPGLREHLDQSIVIQDKLKNNK